ncbi:uncharacterized protein IWZ02DRAFT_450141, partial [Phyllosticta citriasiana]|uniref:uncharacterized protein n=1 Tax=Phyllosticta citriasiana TaxID=595635 RepID=UPI0030FD857D
KKGISAARLGSSVHFFFFFFFFLLPFVSVQVSFLMPILIDFDKENGLREAVNMATVSKLGRFNTRLLISHLLVMLGAVAEMGRYRIL